MWSRPFALSCWDGYDLHTHLRTVHGQSFTLRKTSHHSPVQGLCFFMHIKLVKKVAANLDKGN